MAEFDFDELDRSITEAMSKSGLLKNDSQSVQASAQPAEVTSSPSSSSSPAPVPVEPGKLAPGPGPVANTPVPSIVAANASNQPTSSFPAAGAAVPTQPADSIAVPLSSSRSSSTTAASASTASVASAPGVQSAIQTPLGAKNSVMSSPPSSAPPSVPSLPLQNTALSPAAADSGVVPVRSGLPKAAKVKRRGRFMDIVSSQPGVNKHISRVHRPAVLTPSPVNNQAVPATSSGVAQRPEPIGQLQAQDSANMVSSGELGSNAGAAKNTNSTYSQRQSPEPRTVVRSSGALSQSQQPDSEFASEKDSDEIKDKDEKRSYSIGGTHGRDIAPSAELIESLQKDAQDASNEIGFSQAESRANDIQSIEDASAEDDEDDARIQDPPVPKKHRFMPIGGKPKPKPVEKAPSLPATEVLDADSESSSEQPETVEPQTNNTEDPSGQPTAAESVPPREQTIDEIESGAIYDTSEYYTEFKDDKKHKQSRHSGLKWFLVIIVFLALGALAGAGYFFLTRY